MVVYAPAEVEGRILHRTTPPSTTARPIKITYETEYVQVGGTLKVVTSTPAYVAVAIPRSRHSTTTTLTASTTEEGDVVTSTVVVRTGPVEVSSVSVSGTSSPDKDFLEVGFKV